MKFPKELEKKLYEKLTKQVFDIGKKVKIVVDQGQEKVELEVSEGDIKANEDVYLIDHLWTFKYRDAEKTLRENEQLLDKLLNDIT